MAINFIYEVSKDKYLIWEKKWEKLYNKRYYYQDLGNIEVKDKIELYLEDINFDFEVKSFVYNNKKKIIIKNIEDNIQDFWKITWYTILNIIKNWKKNNFILWQSWEISYDIWVYKLNKFKYNQILKYFWRNIKLNIFPNSFFLVKQIWENIKKWSILYFLKNNTKLINIDKGFYKNIEKIDIWIDEFYKRIENIFWRQINNIENMGSFNQKVYKKELEKFLEPIILFLKDNTVNDNIFIIWNFKSAPLLLKTLWDNLQINIIPIKIENNTFKSIEQADIYCILKQK